MSFHNRCRVMWLLMAVAFVLFLPLIAGMWLDQRLGAFPWWTAGGGVLGGVLGLAIVYQYYGRALDVHRLEHTGDSEPEESRETQSR